MEAPAIGWGQEWRGGAYGGAKRWGNIGGRWKECYTQQARSGNLAPTLPGGSRRGQEKGQAKGDNKGRGNGSGSAGSGGGSASSSKGHGRR